MICQVIPQAHAFLWLPIMQNHNQLSLEFEQITGTYSSSPKAFRYLCITDSEHMQGSSRTVSPNVFNRKALIVKNQVLEDAKLFPNPTLVW